MFILLSSVLLGCLLLPLPFPCSLLSFLLPSPSLSSLPFLFPSPFLPLLPFSIFPPFLSPSLPHFFLSHLPPTPFLISSPLPSPLLHRSHVSQTGPKLTNWSSMTELGSLCLHLPSPLRATWTSVFYIFSLAPTLASTQFLSSPKNKIRTGVF